MTGNGSPALVFTISLALLLPAVTAAAGEADPFSQEVQTDEERARAAKAAAAAAAAKAEEAAKPELSVEPAELTAKLRMDETATLRFTVRNAGGKEFAWSLTEAPGWLGLPTRSGTVKREGEVTVLARVKGVDLEEPGVVTDTLVIVAPGAKGSPFKLPISVEVLPAKPPPQDEEDNGEDDGFDDHAGGPAKPREFGVRASMLLPGGGTREDYSSALAFGVMWRPGRNGEKLGYEVEVSFGGTESASGLETSRMIAGGANALWRFAGNGSQSYYALGGLSLVSEATEDEELGSASTLGSALNLGAGATFAGRYDARVGYSVLIGSENVGGMASASFGFMF